MGAFNGCCSAATGGADGPLELENSEEEQNETLEYDDFFGPKDRTVVEGTLMVNGKEVYV